MRAALFLILAVVLTLTTPVASAAAPQATTAGTTDVTLNAAILKATINPKGSASSYHFEYGTSTEYGRTTAEQAAGSGNDDLAVEASVAGLSHTTIYHYRIVVSNADGVARGFDATFRTREPPQAPTISTAGADEVAPTSAALAGSIDPHDAPTTFYFDYGLTSAYGSRTTGVPITGYGNRVVRQTVGGLAVATQYHYRLVASNAAGTSFGRDQTVTTRRDPTSISVRTTTDQLPLWADVVTLEGRVRGRGVSGIPLSVTRDEFPFGGPVEEAARLTARPDGTFTVRVGPLRTAVRLRVRAEGAGPNPVQSPVVELTNRVRVGVVRRRPASRTRFTLAGLVRPRLPGALASVQRQTRSGRWISLARGRLFDDERGRSRFEISVPRPMRSAAIRVVVLPNDGGAHIRGFSRALKIQGQI